MRVGGGGAGCGGVEIEWDVVGRDGVGSVGVGWCGVACPALVLGGRSTYCLRGEAALAKDFVGQQRHLPKIDWPAVVSQKANYILCNHIVIT